MTSFLLLVLLLAGLPRGALSLWMQGWQMTGSLCQGNQPATCNQLCSSWSQSANGACVAQAANSISPGTWGTLTVDGSGSLATFILFNDAACATPIPNCTIANAAVDGTCTYAAMCDPASGRQTQYSYKFDLIKTLPGYVIALAIFFGGVVPLGLIVLVCYCCCCRSRAKTTAGEDGQQPHEYVRGAYTHEQLREMELAQRHPPLRQGEQRHSPQQHRHSPPQRHSPQDLRHSPQGGSREEQRALEFAERQRSSPQQGGRSSPQQCGRHSPQLPEFAERQRHSPQH